jgi:telomerase Cajal body protein 1
LTDSLTRIVVDDMASECPLNVDDIQLLSDFPLKANTTKDFLKQFKFSPDGLQILASTENNYLRTWDFDVDLINGSKYYRNAADTDNASVGSGTIIPYQEVQCGESIYDFQWYPFMNSNDSASCCFITTCRDHPIHLWDSVIGQIRCSYSCYNAMDELEAANCVTFNLTGDKIYSGSNRMIRSFDVANPGLVA